MRDQISEHRKEAKPEVSELYPFGSLKPRAMAQAAGESREKRQRLLPESRHRQQIR